MKLLLNFKINIQKNMLPIGMLGKEMISLSPKDRVGVMHVVGRSGYGKTVAIMNMVVSDLLNGHAGMVIDPFGDLVSGALEYVPPKNKSNVIVFEATGTNLKDNIKKANKQIDWERLATDEHAFLLCTASYPKIGAPLAREIGLYLLKKYLSLSGKIKRSVIIHAGHTDKIKRSIIVDEGYNFIDDEIIKHIVKARKNNISFLIASQSLYYYQAKQFAVLAKSADHVICYSVDNKTAEMVHENFMPEVSVDNIKNLERFSFYTKLTMNNKKQAATKYASVFPLSYPK